MLQMQRGYILLLFSANQRSQSSLHHLLKLRIWTNWNAEDQLIINIITSYIGEVKKLMPRETLLLIITYFQDLEQETSFAHILGLEASFRLKDSKTTRTLSDKDITCKVGKRLNKTKKNLLMSIGPHMQLFTLFNREQFLRVHKYSLKIWVGPNLTPKNRLVRWKMSITYNHYLNLLQY
jgi:hypothetical protein